MLRIRGGEADLLAVESSDYDDDADENNENQEQYDDEEEETDGEEEETDGEEEETDDEEEEELEKEESSDSEVDESSTSNKTPLVLPPVRVIVRTSLQCGIVDQTLEFTASRKRDVTSIKQSIARQMRGRPPMSSQILRIANRIVSDDETVHSLLEDYDEEEEEENDNEDDDEDKTLTLILDVPPPVDPKFATELGRQLQQMTATQILDAYVTNMAVLHSNAVAMLEDNDDATAHSNTNPPPPTLIPHSVTMKRHALTLRQRLTEQFPPKVLDLLTTQQQETTNDNNNQDDDQDDMTERSLKAKHRRKTSMRGGAKMTVKRALQRNLNINWPDTVRNTLLFVFFGHFGGKSETSRALLLAMAPLCFLLQLRCVKIYLKQIFYAIGKPPGILLSLLPAPQQAIMAFHMPNSMRAVYGIEMGSGVGDNNNDEDEDDTEEDDDASIGEEEKDEEHDGAYDEEYDEEY